MTNGHVVIGEIKTLENGLLTMETDYGDQDFIINWDHVAKLSTNTTFIITLTNKFRVNGTITYSDLLSDYVIILGIEGSRYMAKLLDIVYLKSTESGWIDRFSASIDGGYSITKASNTQQFSLSGNIKYLYTRLSSEVYVNFIDNITQDTIRSKRNNYGATCKVFMGKSLYVLGTSDFLESDEQNLDLRTTLQLGLGKFFLRDHKLSLVGALGLANNSEKYITQTLPSENSLEAFTEMEFNEYGVKDLNLSFKAQYFPSLSRNNRNRLIFSFDSKVDLPLDFYIGLYYTFNYDNKPNANGSKTDYVFQSTFGWQF